MLLEHPFASTDARVLIEDDVLVQVREHRQLDCDANEAGGILLGYRRGEHLHVVDATIPAAHDVRSRFGFLRRDAWHQAVAIKGWSRSQGTLDHMGEWHTHPEPRPQPSRIDLYEWGRLCSTKRHPLVFVIVGTVDCWFGVGRSINIKSAIPR